MADKQSIGLSPVSVANLEALSALGWFADGQDLARFAMAYAIKRGVSPGQTTDPDTRWAIGNFDSTGEMREIMASLFPDVAEPVRAMEHFTNQGLSLLADRVAAGERDLVALLR